MERKRRLPALGMIAAGAAIVSMALGPATANSATRPEAKFSGSPIVIGVPYCETGYLSVSDPYLLDGINIAAKQLNAAGGVLHHQVEVKAEDTQCIAANEVTVANQLILQDGADAIIGGFESTALPAIQPLAEAAHVPYVAAGILPAVSSWGVTTFAPTDTQGLAAVGYVHSVLKLKTIGNISSTTAGGLTIQSDTQAIAKQAGISSKEEQLSNSATDATATLQNVQGAGAILTITTGAINLIMAENATNLGMKQPIILTNDTRADCVAAATKYSHILCLLPAVNLSSHIKDPQIREQATYVYKQFKAEGGTLNTFQNVAVGYDDLRLLAQSMTEAKAVTGKAVENKLDTAKFIGSQARYAFTPGKAFGLKGNPYDVVKPTSGGVTLLQIPVGGL